MSLNNISLTSQLVVDLYGESLIEKSISSGQQETLKFLGKNQKGILILVSKNNVAYLEDDELNFLSSVLSACKLSLADVAVMNISNTHNTNYRDLTGELKSRTVLLFDVEAQTIDLPFNFPHFQIQQFDGCTYLSAASLKTIEKDKVLKTQLWNCLKKLFVI